MTASPTDEKDYKMILNKDSTSYNLKRIVNLFSGDN